ncbi:MAG: nitrous oxidase accessory protein NosD [Arenicella sp.]|jgi:nitrous oxidase accessory protein NosD
MTPPTPVKMTTAVSDMETAYTDAAGRAPDATELSAGKIGGSTLTPGTYKWSTNVWIDSDLTLAGDENAVWIFQISGDLIQASTTNVILAGGAKAENVFWQVAGGAGVTLDTGANFAGIVLAHKAIVVRTGAKVNGRLLGQTAVTLDANEVSQPGL